MTIDFPDWVKAIGRMLAYGITSALVLVAVAITLSGPSQQERQLTARNVELLVRESRLNREVLCRHVLTAGGPASTDPRVRELCADIGAWEGEEP